MRKFLDGRNGEATMAVRHSGGGAADRTLALLWRNHKPATQPDGQTKLGRRPTLDLDKVVDAGIALADEQGLTAASMSGVAKALGVGTMTLYTYVPSKEELLDLMVDQVLAERDLPAPGEPRPTGWRDQINLYSEQTRAMFHRHPWLAGISTIRPPVGPGMLAAREYLLSACAVLGLSPARPTQPPSPSRRTSTPRPASRQRATSWSARPARATTPGGPSAGTSGRRTSTRTAIPR